MANLAVPNSAANIYLEDGRTPESLSSAGFVPFLRHFVAILAQFVCNFWTILKTCLRCFDAIIKRAEAGPGRAEAWAGRAEAQNGGFLIWIYQKIGEIWSWAGRGPKWGLLIK